jgi:hypothetical protein
MHRSILGSAVALAAFITPSLFAADEVATRKSDDVAQSKYVKLVNVGTGKILGVDSDSEDDEAAAMVTKDSGSTARQWRLEKDGEFLKVINRKSGKVLDVSRDSTDEEAPIIQYMDKTESGENFDNQRWKWRVSAPGSPGQLVSKLSQFVLDIDDQGFLVQRKSDQKAKNQLWRIAEIPIYVKLVHVQTGKVLGVTDDSTEDSAQAMLVKDVPPSDANSQTRQWKIQKADNFIMLVNRKSGKALDVSEWSNDDDGIIIIYEAKPESDGNANQQWTLKSEDKPTDSKTVDSKPSDGKPTDSKPSDSGRRISSRSSGLVLDVDSEGKIVQRHSDGNAKSQLWRVVEVND